jgi:predicted membrane protein
MNKKQLTEGILIWIIVIACLILALIKPMKSNNWIFYAVAAGLAILYGVRNPVRKK